MVRSTAAASSSEAWGAEAWASVREEGTLPAACPGDPSLDGHPSAEARNHLEEAEVVVAAAAAEDLIAELEEAA